MLLLKECTAHFYEFRLLTKYFFSHVLPAYVRVRKRDEGRLFWFGLRFVI